MLQIPKRVPENGFYYHYKHDLAGEFNNYAYEIVGVGHHTEDEVTVFVIYRPLYESSVYLAGKMFDVRPLEMFMEEVTKDGKTFPRFQKITDPELCAKLEKLKQEMYA
jgi:hypothetical protein